MQRRVVYFGARHGFLLTWSVPFQEQGSKRQRSQLSDPSFSFLWITCLRHNSHFSSSCWNMSVQNEGQTSASIFTFVGFCCRNWGAWHSKKCSVCHTGSSNRAVCSQLGEWNLQTQDPGPQAKAGWVRCCGDTYSLSGEILAHQMHSWHHVCRQETYGVELVSTPERDASCFLNFFGNVILCNLCKYTLLNIYTICYLWYSLGPWWMVLWRQVLKWEQRSCLQM